MQRTITVKGGAEVSARPDYVVLSMTLEAHAEEYDGAMELAAVQLDGLRDSLDSIGFERDCFKTTNFNVRTDYQHVQDANGNYYNKFNGFVCSHNLKLEFDFETSRMSRALSAVTNCLANPQLSVAFTVKDPNAISEELLRKATVSARKRAEILSESAGVRLGQLLSIDYNYAGQGLVSNTMFSVADGLLRGAAPMKAKAIDIRPDDIVLRDTVTFVWGIE